MVKRLLCAWHDPENIPVLIVLIFLSDEIPSWNPSAREPSVWMSGVGRSEVTFWLPIPLVPLVGAQRESQYRIATTAPSFLLIYPPIY